MLTVLGLNVVRKLIQGKKVNLHAHEHGARPHLHLLGYPHQHDGEAESNSTFSLSRRAIIVGTIHGLAGSAALMSSHPNN